AASLGPFEAGGVEEAGTGFARFLCHPAEKIGSAAGEERIARRKEVDASEIRSVKPDPRNAPCQMVWQVEIPCRPPDHGGARMDPGAGLALHLDHGHAQAARGSRPRCGEPGKARAHDYKVESHGSRPWMSPRRRNPAIAAEFRAPQTCERDPVVGRFRRRGGSATDLPRSTSFGHW